jgi:hypothetical protein
MNSEGHEIMYGIWNCMLEETTRVLKIEPMILE